MLTNSNVEKGRYREAPGFLHHLWTCGLAAFFLCMILPFVATLFAEGPRIKGLYHRDLDDSNPIVNFANSLGLWPLFLVLFAAAVPAVSIAWASWKQKPYFKNFNSAKYYAGLIVAFGYSLTYWLFCTPWSNLVNWEGILWALVMAVVWPGLNLLVISILVVWNSSADETRAENNQSGFRVHLQKAEHLSRQKEIDHRYVWVFDINSKPTGIWVVRSLLESEMLESTLKMAIAMQVNSIKQLGHNPDKAGFNLDLYIAFAERQYRVVTVGRLEVGNNIAFENGAFLMLGNAKAPSEASRPIEEWEVRKNGGYPNLLPIRR